MTGIAGVYRSEKYVVVERHRHRFPQLCIWCNGAIAGAAPAAADGGDAIRLPVCTACTAMRSRVPKIVAVFGVLALLAAPLLYLKTGVLVGGAMFFGSLIDLVIAWRLHVAARGYHAVREDEQYVWISGADSEFLAALPQWPGMKLGELASRNG